MTLKIGDIIEVKALAVPEYHNEDPKNVPYRHIMTERFDFPQRAWYVGYTFRYYGRYDPGDLTRTFSAWDEPPDYEPPRLVPEGSHKVYRIRFHERGKEHHCFPEDTAIVIKQEPYL